jgi:uncharacterized protein (TIGR01777 family)
MQTVLITGGTGMVGKAIATLLLDKGYHVIVLTRKAPVENPRKPGIEYALWNIKAQTIDINALQKADHIIHLAGAGVVDKKWTAAYKQEIQESRTESSKLIIDALKNNPNKVKTVVSASAIGWYGEDAVRGAKAFVETDAAAKGFLGETCQLWEQSVAPVEELDKRLVKVRTGIVLSNEGGALAEFKKPVNFGIAGILGNGKQVVSWIHIDDLCRLYIYAIENEQLSGSYNAVAPEPVTNKTLTIELAQKMKGKFFIPLHVPSFILKIMLGDRSIEVLKSTTVSCAKIKQTGFSFLYPTINAALEQLCSITKHSSHEL